MSQVLVIDDELTVDRLGAHIANRWLEWDQIRSQKHALWEETQKYVFATDTAQTSNSQLPWSNKTTLPKLCQIRDNLFANYMASMFPKRKWLKWSSDSQEDAAKEKVDAIEGYMEWAIDRNEWYTEIAKIVLDYIDYGNAFGMPDWVDDRVHTPDRTDQVGYVGPIIRRISPLDIVFNPTVSDFKHTPKIVRSIVSLGEVKKMLEQLSGDPAQDKFNRDLWDYMRKIRSMAKVEYDTPMKSRDAIYSISGFTSFQLYLESESVEILTYYGDYLNEDTGEYEENRVVKIVDRHKVLSNEPNPSFFGTAPIYHAGWRVRPDNLWAMGPLDNLVGMQYRIDHLENMKADLWDLTAFPPLKIKGHVEEFTWGPFEHIYVGDDGDVEVLAPNSQVLAADTEIAFLQNQMEEMAGSPREAMGFRTPGEKTAFEVQRLENAASRVFQNKIAAFERSMVEQLLNGQLELARRLVTTQTIKVFDQEFQVDEFRNLTVDEITGQGRIKPFAARHFAEQAQMVQNLTAFYNSPAAQAVAMHFSTIKQAELWEDLLEISDWGIVSPYIAITEQADAQRRAQVSEEQVGVEGGLPTGTSQDDTDVQV